MKNEEKDRYDNRVDRVIEEIVSCGDVDLVEKLAHCQMREPVEPPPRSILPPLEFLNRVLSVDYSDLDRKINWIDNTRNGLDSILEDILSLDSSTNLIDCY